MDALLSEKRRFAIEQGSLAYLPAASAADTDSDDETEWEDHKQAAGKQFKTKQQEQAELVASVTRTFLSPAFQDKLTTLRGSELDDQLAQALQAAGMGAGTSADVKDAALGYLKQVLYDLHGVRLADLTTTPTPAATAQPATPAAASDSARAVPSSGTPTQPAPTELPIDTAEPPQQGPTEQQDGEPVGTPKQGDHEQDDRVSQHDGQSETALVSVMEIDTGQYRAPQDTARLAAAAATSAAAGALPAGASAQLAAIISAAASAATTAAALAVAEMWPGRPGATLPHGTTHGTPQPQQPSMPLTLPAPTRTLTPGGNAGFTGQLGLGSNVDEGVGFDGSPEPQPHEPHPRVLAQAGLMRPSTPQGAPVAPHPTHTAVRVVKLAQPRITARALPAPGGADGPGAQPAFQDFRDVPRSPGGNAAPLPLPAVDPLPAPARYPPPPIGFVSFAPLPAGTASPPRATSPTRQAYAVAAGAATPTMHGATPGQSQLSPYAIHEQLRPDSPGRAPGVGVGVGEGPSRQSPQRQHAQQGAGAAAGGGMEAQQDIRKYIVDLFKYPTGNTGHSVDPSAPVIIGRGGTPLGSRPNTAQATQPPAQQPARPASPAVAAAARQLQPPASPAMAAAPQPVSPAPPPREPVPVPEGLQTAIDRTLAYLADPTAPNPHRQAQRNAPWPPAGRLLSGAERLLAERDLQVQLGGPLDYARFVKELDEARLKANASLKLPTDTTAQAQTLGTAPMGTATAPTGRGMDAGSRGTTDAAAAGAAASLRRPPVVPAAAATAPLPARATFGPPPAQRPAAVAAATAAGATTGAGAGVGGGLGVQRPTYELVSPPIRLLWDDDVTWNDPHAFAQAVQQEIQYRTSLAVPRKPTQQELDTTVAARLYYQPRAARPAVPPAPAPSQGPGAYSNAPTRPATDAGTRPRASTAFARATAVLAAASAEREREQLVAARRVGATLPGRRPKVQLAFGRRVSSPKQPQPASLTGPTGASTRERPAGPSRTRVAAAAAAAAASAFSQRGSSDQALIAAIAAAVEAALATHAADPAAARAPAATAEAPPERRRTAAANAAALQQAREDAARASWNDDSVSRVLSALASVLADEELEHLRLSLDDIADMVHDPVSHTPQPPASRTPSERAAAREEAAPSPVPKRQPPSPPSQPPQQPLYAPNVPSTGTDAVYPTQQHQRTARPQRQRFLRVDEIGPSGDVHTYGDTHTEQQYTYSAAAVPAPVQGPGHTVTVAPAMHLPSHQHVHGWEGAGQPSQQRLQPQQQAQHRAAQQQSAGLGPQQEGHQQPTQQQDQADTETLPATALRPPPLYGDAVWLAAPAAAGPRHAGAATRLAELGRGASSGGQGLPGTQQGSHRVTAQSALQEGVMELLVDDVMSQVLVRAAASAAPAGRAHVDPAAAWSAAAEVPVITDAQVAYRLAREVLQERLEEMLAPISQDQPPQGTDPVNRPPPTSNNTNEAQHDGVPASRPTHTDSGVAATTQETGERVSALQGTRPPAQDTADHVSGQQEDDAGRAVALAAARDAQAAALAAIAAADQAAAAAAKSTTQHTVPQSVPTSSSASHTTSAPGVPAVQATAANASMSHASKSNSDGGGSVDKAPTAKDAMTQSVLPGAPSGIAAAPAAVAAAQGPSNALATAPFTQGVSVLTVPVPVPYPFPYPAQYPHSHTQTGPALTHTAGTSAAGPSGVVDTTGRAGAYPGREAFTASPAFKSLQHLGRTAARTRVPPTTTTTDPNRYHIPGLDRLLLDSSELDSSADSRSATAHAVRRAVRAQAASAAAALRPDTDTDIPTGPAGDARTREYVAVDPATLTAAVPIMPATTMSGPTATASTSTHDTAQPVVNNGTNSGQSAANNVDTRGPHSAAASQPQAQPQPATHATHATQPAAESSVTDLTSGYTSFSDVQPPVVGEDSKRYTESETHTEVETQGQGTSGTQGLSGRVSGDVSGARASDQGGAKADEGPARAGQERADTGAAAPAAEPAAAAAEASKASLRSQSSSDAAAAAATAASSSSRVTTDLSQQTINSSRSSSNPQVGLTWSGDVPTESLAAAAAATAASPPQGPREPLWSPPASPPQGLGLAWLVRNEQAVADPHAPQPAAAASQSQLDQPPRAALSDATNTVTNAGSSSAARGTAANSAQGDTKQLGAGTGTHRLGREGPATEASTMSTGPLPTLADYQGPIPRLWRPPPTSAAPAAAGTRASFAESAWGDVSSVTASEDLGTLGGGSVQGDSSVGAREGEGDSSVSLSGGWAGLGRAQGNGLGERVAGVNSQPQQRPLAARDLPRTAAERQRRQAQR